MAKNKRYVPYLPPLTLLGLVLVVVGVLVVFPPSKLSKKSVSDTGATQEVTVRQFQGETIKLPVPQKTGRTSLEQALNQRRSERSFYNKPVTLNQISQLLWAAQGVTADWGGRTTPSAKDAYPLTVYLIALDVTGLSSGIYQYIPGETAPVHGLGLLSAGDYKEKTVEAGRQSQFKDVPAILIFTGNFEKMAKAFDGRRVDNNVYLEAGHAAQNVYLQVETLGLGTVTTGGFDQEKTRSLLSLPASETLIYMMPIGYPQ